MVVDVIGGDIDAKEEDDGGCDTAAAATRR